MTTRARIAFLAVAVVIAIVAFIVLGSNDKKETSSTPAATTSAKRGLTQINVKGGKPVGGVKTITVNKGDQVRFVVSADVSDEIHVHGYDFHKDVKAGGKALFSFPAKIDGEFVVELESRGEQIAKLVVNP
jgi:heme/copper-type cytochrome/quinol oxidase subunit 2